MQNIVLALLFMSISGFVAIAVGTRAGRSKVFVYALGLSLMLFQIVILFAVRDFTHATTAPRVVNLATIGNAR